jgi:hypothetical protein
MTAPTLRRVPARVARVQLLRRSGAAGTHQQAKSGRGTVRRAAIAEELDIAAELGVIVRGVRF